MAQIQWMSSGEAADFLGITPRTLMKFINNGQLPGYRFGRVIRLKAADVEAFIETLRIQPGDLDHLLPKPTAADAEADEA
jgi:excisionase family DNA binding protein